GLRRSGQSVIPVVQDHLYGDRIAPTTTTKTTVAVQLKNLVAALERKDAEQRARFEQRLGRHLSDEEWLEVLHRRHRRNMRRVLRRSLKGVPRRLRTPRNLRRFERVPLLTLAATIIATDAGRPRWRARAARPVRSRSHCRRRASRAGPLS